MRDRLMTSVAVLTILIGSGAAFGQGTGTKEAPSTGTATQHSPSTAPQSGSGTSTQMNKSQPLDNNQSTPREESTQSGEGERGARQDAQDSRPEGSKRQQSFDHGLKSDRMKSSESDRQKKKDDMNAERRGSETGRDTQHSETRSNTTTGQAGAGAKLSTEQRTKITSVIREQHVQPETNINFSISVGTRVPKSVHFHPLPAEIVTVYPDWRGYEFFRVRDEIVVVDPRTLEIVAVLEV